MRMRICALLLAAAVMTACNENTPAGPTTLQRPSPSLAKASGTDGRVSQKLAAANRRLAARGKDFRVSRAEYVTTGRSDHAGITVFANDRVKQLSEHFVPGDPRRGGGFNITYLVDRSDGATSNGLSSLATEGAIDRAMTTWEGVRCSKIPIDKVADPGFDPDVVDGLLGVGAIGTPIVDITHAGWLPAAFFDLVAPDGSDFFLAVTFTFIFVDEDDNPTDIDGNGKADVAFREIYYNDTFDWGIDTSTDPYDVETVALHETGHGLSQNHFGKIFLTNANGRLHFAPFAVMNAAISRQAQSLKGSDNGGHCSIWGKWPNN
jgi:hypothetical protein